MPLQQPGNVGCLVDSLKTLTTVITTSISSVTYKKTLTTIATIQSTSFITVGSSTESGCGYLSSNTALTSMPLTTTTVPLTTTPLKIPPLLTYTPRPGSNNGLFSTNTPPLYTNSAPLCTDAARRNTASSVNGPAFTWQKPSAPTPMRQSNSPSVSTASRLPARISTVYLLSTLTLLSTFYAA